MISTPTSPSEIPAPEAAPDAADAAALLPAAGARPPRGEIRTPFLSIDIVTSRPSVSFFSITMAGSFLLPALGGFGGLGGGDGDLLGCDR